MIELTVNGERRRLQSPPDTPLLWALRDELKLTGAKYGCGLGLCGACSVELDGNLVRSCVTPLTAAAGKAVLTIEGLPGDASHPVQRAWLQEQAPQCGYCQSGMIMAAVNLLRNRPNPSDQDIGQAITNICRCGTYPRVRKAIRRAARIMAEE